MTYKQGALTFFYSDLAKLSCYLEAKGDNEEGKEEILRGAVNNPFVDWGTG